MERQKKMEVWDLYDAYRHPLGRTARRDEPLRPGEYHVVVGIWVFDGRGHILLTRRDASKRYMPGKWENTGGHVVSGEDSPTAAARELAEETGIQARPEELIFLGTIKLQPFFGDNYALVRNVPAESIRLQPGETDAARWVSLEEFEALAAAGQLAGSVYEHLKQYREAFDRVFHTSQQNRQEETER